MNSKTKNPEQSKPEIKKSHRARKAAVAVVAGVALLKGAQHEAEQTRHMQALQQELTAKEQNLARVTGIVANQLGVEDGVITGESLRSVNSLPGIERLVSPEQRAMLEASTVKIGKRVKGSADPWFASCTATKVTNGSENFIVSAAHCFSGDLASPGGKGGTPDVLNITEFSSYEYAIFLPNEEPGSPLAEPITRSTSLAIDFFNVADLAVMSVSSSAEFDALPALSLEAFTSVAETPTPGEQVALYAMPSSSGNVPVSETGTFLGRVSGVNLGSLSQYVDLVGVNPSLPAEDACNYGASGSSAVFADGAISGALTFRNNIGYDTGINQPEDVNGSQYRLMMESQVGLDLSEFTTVCGFAVPNERSFPLLQSALHDPAGAYYYSYSK